VTRVPKVEPSSERRYLSFSMPFESLTNERGNQPLLRPIMPELDAVRGLAIAMVVVYHAFYLTNDRAGLSPLANLFEIATWAGKMGVGLFFVLSGFLITGLLLDSVHRRDYYPRFYKRRALRILPLYYAVLLVLAVVLPLGTQKFLLFSAVYMANLTPIFGIGIAYPVLWSLAVEEQFYLLWPTVVRNLGRRGLLAVCLFLIVATPVFRALTFLWQAHQGHVRYQFNDYTWNALDGLACGALLALGLRSSAWDRRRWLRFSLISMAASVAFMCLAAPFGILDRQHRISGAALQVVPWHVAFTGFLALVLLIGTGPWKSLVVVPPLRFLGRLSYGLYLIHQLIFRAYNYANSRFFPGLESAVGKFPAHIIRFFIVSVVAIALAHLLREHFEEFFLSMKDRTAPVPATLPGRPSELPAD
jgi:peptidoglycan/LPS O-acetylase OafA/YrhL